MSSVSFVLPCIARAEITDPQKASWWSIFWFRKKFVLMSFLPSFNWTINLSKSGTQHDMLWNNQSYFRTLFHFAQTKFLGWQAHFQTCSTRSRGLALSAHFNSAPKISGGVFSWQETEMRSFNKLNAMVRVGLCIEKATITAFRTTSPDCELRNFVQSFHSSRAHLKLACQAQCHILWKLKRILWQVFFLNQCLFSHFLWPIPNMLDRVKTVYVTSTF